MPEFTMRIELSTTDIQRIWTALNFEYGRLQDAGSDKVGQHSIDHVDELREKFRKLLILGRDSARVITLTPKGTHEIYRDRWGSPNVLRVYSKYVGYTVRLGIGYVGPKGQTRFVQGGPMVSGPRAYTYPKASIIAANPQMGTAAEMATNEAADLEWDAKVGDRFVVDGMLFELTEEQPRSNYPTLTLVEAL